MTSTSASTTCGRLRAGGAGAGARRNEVPDLFLDPAHGVLGDPNRLREPAAGAEVVMLDLDNPVIRITSRSPAVAPGRAPG